MAWKGSDGMAGRSRMRPRGEKAALAEPPCGARRDQELEQALGEPQIGPAVDKRPAVPDGDGQPADPEERPAALGTGGVAGVDQANVGLAGADGRQDGPRVLHPNGPAQHALVQV